MLALPQKSDLIGDECAVGIAEHFDHVSAGLITKFPTVPTTTPEKIRYERSRPVCSAFKQAVLHSTADRTPSRKASLVSCNSPATSDVSWPAGIAPNSE